MVVERVRIVSNVARLGGGGIQASFFNNGPEEDPLLMRFDGCRFENNSGIAGGGVFVFTSTDGMLMCLPMCWLLCSPEPQCTLLGVCTFLMGLAANF